MMSNKSDSVLSATATDNLALYILIVTMGAVISVVVAVMVFTWPTKHTSDPANKLSQMVEFETEAGWSFEVSATNLTLEAADSSFFLFEGPTKVFGAPQQPPLDYEFDEYYHQSQKIPLGQWHVEEGESPSLRFTSADGQPFTVQMKIDARHAVEEAVFCAFIGFLLWVIAILAGAMAAMISS
jgi:hypothetical protein